MAKEILAVPEQHLAEVIRVIRAGLWHLMAIHPTVEKNLKKWCDDEEAYLKRLEREDNNDGGGAY